MDCGSADFLGLAWSLDCDVLIGPVVCNDRSRYKPRSRPQANVTEPKRIVATSDSRGTCDGAFELTAAAGHQEQRQRNKERSERMGNVRLHAEGPGTTE